MIAELLRVLTPFGLDLIGVTTPAAYDALVPSAYRFAPVTSGSIVVIGNGGRAFWDAYRRHCSRAPGWAGREHPLDDFTTLVLETQALPAAERFGQRPRLRLPFRESSPPLSFVHLAEAAGLGRRSILGVLLHPEYGPWMALRGAIMIDHVESAARPAAGFDPCPTCIDRPCISACPAAAVAHPSGWDIPACIAFRVATDPNPCLTRCHARTACVYGRSHRYPDDELAYHHQRAFEVMRGKPH